MALPALFRPAISSTLSDLSISLDDWAAPATDEQGTEWWLTELEGWYGHPGVRLAGQEREGDHGEFDAPSYLPARLLTATGYAQCTSKTAALLASDIVSSLAWDTSQLYTLRVTEPSGDVRRAMVRRSGDAKVRLFEAAIEWQMQFKAPDPRRYDDVEADPLVLTPPSGVAGGLTLPFTVPFEISTSGTSGSTRVATNAGTFPTRPTVTFVGPLVDPTIANLTAGKALSLSITLATGDTLVADMDKRTLLLNGTASRGNTLTSSAAWWELAPGGNDIALTAGGGSGTATVRWRSARI